MCESGPDHQHQHPHRHPHHHGPNRPDNLGSFIANLRGTGLPWRRVLALVAANFWRKITTMQGCCGHPGQAGC